MFIPRKGTELDDVQAAIEKEWRDREAADEVEDVQREERGEVAKESM